MKINSYLKVTSLVFAFSFPFHSISHAQSVSWRSLNGPSGVFSTLATGQDNDGHIFVSTWSPTYVYMSSDDGLTWEKTDLINQEVSDFAAKDSGLIFAAAFYGIYKSIDHGMHWQLINDTLNSNISIHISKHGTIYVGTFYQGLVKSTDDGLTWTSAGLVGQTIELINSDSSGILFAVTDNGGFRSTDDGRTWMKIDSLKYGANSFLIDSKNRVYASDGISLYLSVDQGESWKRVNTLSDGYREFYLLTSHADSLYAAKSEGMFLSADGGVTWRTLKWFPSFMNVRSLVVTQNYTLIANFSQGGVFRSVDRGQSWKSVGYGMGLLPINTVCSDTSGIVFAGAYQGVFSNKNGNSAWENAVGIDSMISPFVVSSFLQKKDGKLYAGGSGGIYSTQNQGANWVYDAIGDIQVIALSPSNAIIAANYWYTLWGSYSDIYKSTDGGKSWNKVCTTGAINNFAISEIGNMYACTGFGMIKSTNDGVTWDTLSFNSNPIHWLIVPVKQMVASPTGFLLCLSSDSVFVSYDEGITWRSTCRLKGVSAVVAGSNGTIYAGTQDQGVLVSSDSGVTWQQSNNGLNDVNISCLSIASDGTLLCGTVSGGVFRSFETVVVVPKVTSNNVTDFLLSQNYPNPFNPSTTIAFSLPHASHVELVIYDYLGREVQTLMNDVHAAGRYDVQFNANSLSSGLYIYRMTAGNYSSARKMILMK